MTTFAAAAQSIADLEAEIAAENDRRYAFYRMLHATDRLLNRLEELNRDGVKALPAGERVRMRESLGELPAACLAVFSNSDVVQDILNCLFRVQDRLFAWHNPDYVSEDEEAM